MSATHSPASTVGMPETKCPIMRSTWSTRLHKHPRTGLRTCRCRAGVDSTGRYNRALRAPLDHTLHIMCLARARNFAATWKKHTSCHPGCTQLIIPNKQMIKIPKKKVLFETDAACDVILERGRYSLSHHAGSGDFAWEGLLSRAVPHPSASPHNL